MSFSAGCPLAGVGISYRRIWTNVASHPQVACFVTGKAKGFARNGGISLPLVRD